MNENLQITPQSSDAVTLPTKPVTAHPRPSLDGSLVVKPVQGWGWFPGLSLSGALGLVMVAAANTLSRAGQPQYEFLLWAGLLTLMVPVTVRLASTFPTRRERLSLIVLVTIGLYLVKVIHSPHEFIYSDELVHVHNANSILENGTLFNSNSILPVTPFYPGLETATAALASLSGLSVFGAGVIIIGIARLVMGLALFLMYEEVGRSARAASLAALLYATNANFLYWSAQYSYESVALPLAVLVLFLALRRTKTNSRAARFGLTIMILVTITAIVVTHHLTSYFLVAFFVAWTLLSLFLRLKTGQPAAGVRSVSVPAGLAAFSIAVTLLWLFTTASSTTNYLSPVLGRAFGSMVDIVAGEATTRQLFQSAGGYVAPVWERITGLGAVFLMLLGLPFGVRHIRRQFRQHPVVLILLGAALLYFVMLTLRLSPQAWETGNRASEFLFVGLAFVLAFATVELWDTPGAVAPLRAAIVVAIAIIFVGGVIAGWSPTLRLGRPLQVAVGPVVIKPQGFAAANWMKQTLGPAQSVAADQSNVRWLVAYGQQTAYAGAYPNIRGLLGVPAFPAWQTDLIQEYELRYIVVDRRAISWNNMEGYYFDRTGGGPIAPAELRDPALYEKFDRLPAFSRIYDSGNIVIYDAKAILHATPNQ